MIIAFNNINEVAIPVMNNIGDGKEEMLARNICHICKKGSSYSIINTGNENLLLLKDSGLAFTRPHKIRGY